MVKSLILTERELEVIEKKLMNKRLNQQDSNYLSRYVRPKLKEIKDMNAGEIISKLTYNQKTISIENKIRKLVLNNLKNIKAIILYGSAVYNNYEENKDIDILIIVKKIGNLREKYVQINKLEELGRKEDYNLDIQILSEETYESEYNKNPNLIYQLKDSKTIYGKISLPKNIEIYKMDLYTKLDYSSLEDIQSDGEELYKSLRNIILVRLLSRGVVNNYLLNEIIKSILGEELTYKLKYNKTNRQEKKEALKILNLLEHSTSKEVKNLKWEKKLLLNH